jgi:hypothetical protein
MKRVKAIIIFIFLGIQFIHAQCISGDCLSGRGTYLFKSGARYVGTFENGEIHGVGTLYYSDGRRYSGEWANRYQEGKGIMTYPDGRTQKGEWKKGHLLSGNDLDESEEEVQNGCIAGNCENGAGTYVYADGSKYQGDFEGSKKNGQGQYWLANGEHYSGNWKDNYMHGTGTKYLVTGDSLHGVFQGGAYVGVENTRGKIGCLNGDCFNGEGIYVASDGSKYIGNFRNGMFDGEGTCIYTNGDKYIGGWNQNLFHEEGIMYFANGKIVGGIWDNGAISEVRDQVADSLSRVVSQNSNFDPEVKIWAVVVGVAKYNHMRTLSYTDDDAYRVAMFLKSPEGGALPEEQIAILIDEQAKKRNILTAMHDVFSNADSNDMVLFYFSGHGLKGSFIPYDFDGFNNQISHEDVTKLMESSPAKFKVCIADACHSGSLDAFAARSAMSASSIIETYYETFDNIESSTVLLLSSKAEEKSLESSGLRQGIFSHFLIRGLKGEADYDQNGIVKITELYHFIFVNVQAYTGDRQTPLIKGKYDGNMPMGMVSR